MFKWGRNKKSSSYEPKTPKLSSISLPDERYVPVHIYQSYSEKPHTKSHLRESTPSKRASTPVVQPTTHHREIPSVRSRPRTMSTPMREVEGMSYATLLSIQLQRLFSKFEAPRPIRPHPSQGPFLPTLDHRTNPSHVALVPVGGESFPYHQQPLGFDLHPVPSAAFLEEQLRRQAAETRPPPPPKKMSEFRHVLLFFCCFLRQCINLVDVSEYVYPEETKLREVAKRTGATVTTREFPLTEN